MVETCWGFSKSWENDKGHWFLEICRVFYNLNASIFGMIMSEHFFLKMFKTDLYALMRTPVWSVPCIYCYQLGAYLNRDQVHKCWCLSSSSWEHKSNKDFLVWLRADSKHWSAHTTKVLTGHPPLQLMASLSTNELLLLYTMSYNIIFLLLVL